MTPVKAGGAPAPSADAGTASAITPTSATTSLKPELRSISDLTRYLLLNRPESRLYGYLDELALAELNLCAAVVKRSVSRLSQPDHVAGERESIFRKLPGADCVYEGAGLQRQRLCARQVGRADVAAAIGQLPFAERLRILVLDSATVDLDRLRSPILVHHHLLRADDHRASQLARRQPAELDVGDQARAELQVHECHIGDSGDDRIAAGGADRVRGGAQPVEQDREVVGP